MTKTFPQYPRILGIALSTRGFGFALIEGLDVLADWGVSSTKGDKNTGTLEKVQAMIEHYEPDVIALENTSGKPFRRSARIRALTKQIVTMARRRNIHMSLSSREQRRQTFFGEGQGTNHTLAELLADKFPEELGFRLPPKRRPWMSEDYRMNIFAAVAVALMVRRSINSEHESKSL